LLSLHNLLPRGDPHLFPGGDPWRDVPRAGSIAFANLVSTSLEPSVQAGEDFAGGAFVHLVGVALRQAYRVHIAFGVIEVRARIGVFAAYRPDHLGGEHDVVYVDD